MTKILFRDGISCSYKNVTKVLWTEQDLVVSVRGKTGGIEVFFDVTEVESIQWGR